MQFLNVAGAKRRLAPWIISHFGQHKLYVEPYGGSGAVLLAKERAAMEVYNDLSKDLVLFFQTLAQHPDDLLQAIDCSLYSGVIDDVPTEDTVELARRFFQRNNTTWTHSGAFKSQSRVTQTNRTVTTVFEERKKHLHWVAERIRGVVFECRDALEVIKKYDGPDTLLYVDPPYYGERKADLYKHEMADETSHRRLAEVLHVCQGSVVLSGYPSDLYRELYGDWAVDSRLTLSNAKDRRMEFLWIKSEENIPQPSQKLPVPRSNREITRQRIQEAAKCPLNGQNRRSVSLPLMDHIDQQSRAKSKGIGSYSQWKLDKIACVKPELLKKIADGDSLNATFKLCYNGHDHTLLRSLKTQFLKLSQPQKTEFKEWLSTDPEPISKIADLSGRQFGKWTVLNNRKRSATGTFWKCHCQCGTTKWVLENNLKQGTSTSCGCSSIINLSNKQFEKWTVLGQHKSSNNFVYWQCRCQCGAVKWVRGNSLKSGKSRSCRSCARRKPQKELRHESSRKEKS
jgi:DNA adenine methylase